MSLNLFSYADSDSSEDKDSSPSPQEMYPLENLVIHRKTTPDSNNKGDNIPNVDSVSKGTETHTSERIDLHNYCV